MANTNDTYELIELIQKIYNQGRLDPFISFIDSQNRILLYLLTHENAHPSEISEELNFSRSNIANCMKQLEQLNYIERSINAENRREIYVNITDKGREYITIQVNEICKIFSLWLDMLGDESEHLINILRISSSESSATEEFYRLADELKKNAHIEGKEEEQEWIY